MNTRLIIDRKFYHDCTTGRVSFGDFHCHSLELPWLNNDNNVSCIPNGIYHCKKINSPNHGECFKIMNVPFRSLVRGHIGNFISSTLGCVLFGDSIKDFNNDGILDVTSSGNTFRKLMSLLPEEFILEIGQPSWCGIR